MKEKEILKYQLKTIIFDFIESNQYDENIQRDLNNMVIEKNHINFFSKYISKDKEYINLIKEKDFVDDYYKYLTYVLKNSPYLDNTSKDEPSFSISFQYFLRKPNKEFFDKNYNLILAEISFIHKLLIEEEFFEKCKKEIPDLITRILNKENAKDYFSANKYNFLLKRLQYKINKTEPFVKIDMGFFKYAQGLTYENLYINNIGLSKKELKIMIDEFDKEIIEPNNLTLYKCNADIDAHIKHNSKFNHTLCILREFSLSHPCVKLDTNFTRNLIECLKEKNDEKAGKVIEFYINSIIDKEINKKLDILKSKDYNLRDKFNILKTNDNLELLKEYHKINPNISKFILFDGKLKEIYHKNGKIIGKKNISLKMGL